MSLEDSRILQTLMKWRTRISAAAWVVVRDTHAAEDIFQNVALKAMTKDVQFDGESSVVSWAFVAVRRESIDWLRRHRREALVVEGLISDGVFQALSRDWLSAGSVVPESRVSAMEECLKSTPGDARHLLRMRYFDGYSCEEVAERMGIQLNAVYKRLSRLHEALRKCIEGRLAATVRSETGAT